MSELGAGTRGASLGLDAIRIASFKLNPRFFKKVQVRKVPNENHMLFEEVTTPYAKRLDGVVRMYERIATAVSDELLQERFPLVISGDHSNAGGTIAGIKQAYPEKRLGVIWIDAHADIHSPYTSPSGNIHGMPLATALSEDNLTCKIKNIPELTRNNWDALKGESPRVHYGDLVYVGVRDYEKAEEYLMIRHKIPHFTVQQVREEGIEGTVHNILGAVADCDVIYISFDVDSMDPTVSRGTGTPVPGGFSEKEASELLNLLLEDEKVVCMEMTEINPVLDDKGNAMGEAAFRILEKVVKVINKRFKKTDAST
jgi:arginase